MTFMTRRSILLAGAALTASRSAFASFPERPLRIVVPWNPGAAADIMARAMAQAMSQDLGKSVVVENRAGANGSIGSQTVANAAPDGHTLLVSNADTHAINPFIFRKLAYDPVKGFEPISLFARVPFALIAGPSKPEIVDVRSLIATAKANPRALTYASWGTGSTSHIGMEIIMRAVGIEMHHVPFSGQAPGLLAVQAGQVDTMLLTAGGADAGAKGGRARVLGLAADSRLALMDSTATLREQGVDVVAGNWFGLHVPAGTPRDVVRQLSELTGKVLRDEKVRETFRVQAAIPEATGVDAFGRFVVAEQERWGGIVKAANIVIE